jgi:hypothetical protein
MISLVNQTEAPSMNTTGGKRRIGMGTKRNRKRKRKRKRKTKRKIKTFVANHTVKHMV